MINSVSLNQVVSNAMISLGSENDSDKVLFYEWANDCLRSMGFVDLNISTFTGTISDPTAVTGGSLDISSISPKAMYINNISVSSGGTSLIYPTFNSNYWGNTNNISAPSQTTTATVTRSTSPSTPVSPVSDFLYFFGLPGSGWTTGSVSYYSMPVDEYGSPLIQETFISPIVAYIDYRLARRNQSSNQGSVTSQDVNLLYQIYDKEKNQAILKKNRPDKIVVPGVGAASVILKHPLL
jgi:hypothetical protein